MVEHVTHYLKRIEQIMINKALWYLPEHKMSSDLTGDVNVHMF